MEDIQNLLNKFFEQFTDEKIKTNLKFKLGKASEENAFFIPSVEFEQYLICKEKYDQSKTMLNKLEELSKTNDPRALHESRISKPVYQTLIDNNLKIWISLGFKNEIEKIIKETI